MMLRSTAKRLRIDRYDIYIVIALIILATLARFILIQNNWPVTNSDEGNMALLARHVAYNGEWPIFFYGLPYMGPIEGYIAAPLFHIFGPSTFSLRLGLLPFFPLFLICMYFLTRLLYTRWLALFTVLVLCFGADEVIMRQLKAVGEYPELLFFASFISLVVVWLALSSQDERHMRWQRYLLYGVLGLVTGVALWVDFLILPFVGTGALLLWIFCRRDLRSWKLLALLAGIVIGAFPLIYYNLTAPITQNSLVVLVSIDRSGSNLHLPFLQQLSGTFFIALPNVLSFNPACSPEAFPYFGPVSKTCMALQGGWSAGYLLLLGVATYGAFSLALRGWKGKSLLHPDWTHEQRQEMALQCGRLMLLVSAIGTLLLYAFSPAPAAYPAPTARYINCILIAFPAVLWPLWNGIGARWSVPGWQRRAMLAGRVVLLLLVLFMFVVGTFRTFGEIPAAQASYRSQELLVQKLEALGATRIYSEYWTCNRLTFQSQEKVICSALDTNLQPGFDRYPPYREMVHAAPHPAYAFPLGLPQVALLDRKLANDATFRETYQRLVYEGYVLYVPLQKP